MNNTTKNWSAVARVGKRGLMKGFWLKNPEGKIVAVFNGKEANAYAKQCAAAMNLTTMAQRVDWIASQAGYGK